MAVMERHIASAKSGRTDKGTYFVVRARKPGLVAYVTILVLALGAVQLAASLTFYQAINRQTVREDHARRIAELLVVSDRIYAMKPEEAAQSMTTRFLSASVTSVPSVPIARRSSEFDEITRSILLWEPSLADRSLRVTRAAGQNGKEDLVGSIRLPDGNWMNFRSLDISSMWPVAIKAIATTLVAAACLMALALMSLHLLTRPLRRLTKAAEQIGHRHDITVSEEGPRDIQNLAHAMNHMQARISRLIRDQAKSFEAISHDLRTPLSRQKLAAELIDDAEIGAMMLTNVDEMEGLLASLQQFLRAQHMQVSPQTVDIVELIRGVIARFEDRISLRTVGPIEYTTYAEPLTVALAALLENAVHYGSKVTVDVEDDVDGPPVIVIQDDGPGIPAANFENILDPFFRLDDARSRDTAGFGLGIPTAHRLMERFSGGLSFGASDTTGLLVRLTIPVVVD
ncbi:ATP-binding protein [Croceicoccus sp. Ery5]|uniref:ATP-binding protein n=1 Tax=Croceicoccus sp. Ery5 TaxID=1703340 RepID=UPI001E651B73|nr:ATP-binding protein [Croceicoccus sp. Ery5]